MKCMKRKILWKHHLGSFKRGLIFVSILVLAVGALSAEGQREDRDEDAGEGSLVIIDSLGREVLFQEPVEKILPLQPTASEALRVLGAWDRVVARDQWTKDPALFPGLDGIPVISGGAQGRLDYEAIIRIDPDLVLIGKSAGMDQHAVIEKLSPYMNVLLFDFGDAELLSRTMITLGDLLECRGAAEQFCNLHKEVLTLVRDRTQEIPEEQKPLVFMRSEGWTDDQLCTMTDASSMARAQIAACGGLNIAADLPGQWIEELDREWLSSQRPDVIIMPIWGGSRQELWGLRVEDESEAERLRNILMGMEELRYSPAVKNDRVYLYESALTISPAAAIAMLYNAHWYFPEKFTDIDPLDYHQRYLELMNISIDLHQEGLFTYPSMKE